MRYRHIRRAVFLARPNRFIAWCAVEGVTVTCHVKNTGRCRELLRPGAAVWLEESENPDRRTAFDLVAVDKGGLLINMDAQAPNKVFAEWAESGGFTGGLTLLRPEYTWEDSRFDFYYEAEGGRRGFVEVKGVTLENGGIAAFPDAPTERGVKHLRGLARAAGLGYEATVCFIIQMEGMKRFEPNERTHPEFGQALREAAAAGVNVVAMECRVTPDSLTAARPVPVSLRGT